MKAFSENRDRALQLWTWLACVLLMHTVLRAVDVWEGAQPVKVCTSRPRIAGCETTAAPATVRSVPASPEAPSVSAVDGVLPEFKRIFRESGVPPGFVWIAEVESSWNARAVSRALQANGSNDFDELAVFLPAETRRYVDKVLSTVLARQRQADPRA